MLFDLKQQFGREGGETAYTRAESLSWSLGLAEWVAEKVGLLLAGSDHSEKT